MFLSAFPGAPVYLPRSPSCSAYRQIVTHLSHLLLTCHLRKKKKKGRQERAAFGSPVPTHAGAVCVPRSLGWKSEIGEEHLAGNVERLLQHVGRWIKIQCRSTFCAVLYNQSWPWTLNMLISKSVFNCFHPYGNLAVFNQSYLLSWLIPRLNSMNHTYNSVMESGQLPLL